MQLMHACVLEQHARGEGGAADAAGEGSHATASAEHGSRRRVTEAMAAMRQVRVKVLIGGYAQKWHLGRKTGVTETAAAWRDHPPGTFALPHPSWRNTGWLRRHPWFEAETLPALRRAIKDALT